MSAWGKLLGASDVPSGASNEDGGAARQPAVGARRGLVENGSPTVFLGPASCLVQLISGKLGLLHEDQVDSSAIEPMPC